MLSEFLRRIKCGAPATSGPCEQSLAERIVHDAAEHEARLGSVIHRRWLIFNGIQTKIMLLAPKAETESTHESPWSTRASVLINIGDARLHFHNHCASSAKSSLNWGGHKRRFINNWQWIRRRAATTSTVNHKFSVHAHRKGSSPRMFEFTSRLSGEPPT